MMMVPSKECVSGCLQAADEALKAAQLLLSGGMFRSAASRAYYAMFHAAQALLYSHGLKPKSHSGLIHMFREHVVAKRLVDSSLAIAISRAFKLRQDSDYAALIRPQKAEVGKVVRDAEEFVAAMKRLLEEKGPG